MVFVCKDCDHVVKTDQPYNCSGVKPCLCSLCKSVRQRETKRRATTVEESKKRLKELTRAA